MEGAGEDWEPDRAACAELAGGCLGGFSRARLAGAHRDGLADIVRSLWIRRRKDEYR